jgi:hypothetical protein
MRFLCTAAVLLVACGSDSGTGGAGGSAGCGGSGGSGGSGGAGGSGGTGGMAGSGGSGGTAGSGGTGGSGGCPGLITHQVEVGPGYSDVSPHQLVRTSAGALYVAAPTCNSFPSCNANTLKMFRADGPALPTSFTELDPTHEPGDVGTVALAIDGSDRVHVAWDERGSGGRARYAVFDTSTNTWGTPETIEQSGWTTFGQGDEGVALAVDAAGAPHAAWSFQGSDGTLRVHWAVRGSSWSSPVELDDVRVRSSRHPTLAFAPSGELRLMWLDGGSEYAMDGIIRSRTRSTGGVWSASAAIPDQAMTAIDNGPSLMVTADGVAHASFCNYNMEIRYWYDAGSGWQGDQQPAPVQTHDPSLGPDGAGGLYIYGHGSPVGSLNGHGNDVFFLHKGAGGTTWSAWTRFVTGSFDSSVSVRWSQFFHHFPGTLDIVYWSDPYPNFLFFGTN